MQETVSMLALAVVSLLVFSALFGFYALDSFAQNQELRAAQIIALASIERGGVTASGNNTLVYTPLTPGLEANGGVYSYIESAPYQYSYSYPVTSWVPYSYYAPQNSFITVHYSVPQTESAAYTYTMYFSQATAAQYSVPYSTELQYAYTSYEQTRGTANTVTFLGCPSLVSHMGCWFAHYTRILAGFVTYTVPYSYTYYSQASESSAYPTPYVTTSTGSYMLLQSSQSAAEYTVPTSSPYSCSYTVYDQGGYEYVYLTPVNSEHTGVYYLNQTKIENGQYEVVQVPQSYTYWSTSWQKNSAMYYYGIPALVPTTCYRPGTNKVGYTLYTPYRTVHSYTFDQSGWKQQSYTEYHGEPTTVSGSYLVSYPVFATLYGWYSYNYAVHSFVTYQALAVRHYSSFLQTRWRSTTAIWYTPEQSTYSAHYLYTAYSPQSANFEETLGETQHFALYASSRLARASTLAYDDYVISPAYSYYQATFTNEGSLPVNITAILYQNGSAVYTVPVAASGWNTGLWLASEKWDPGRAWLGWNAWGGGVALGDGYTGYNTGLPFITDGAYADGRIVLESGQSLSVPFVNGFAVGFVSTSGDVWWIA